MKNLVRMLAGLFCVLLMSFGFSSCQQEDIGIKKSVILINVVAPAKTTYGIGQQLDKTGMVVTAIWNDGTSEVVNDYSISGFDSSKVVNAQDVIVNYKGKMASFRVRIMEIKPVSLVISKKPLKQIYTIGSTFDKTGMEVICNYNDDSKEIITDYTLSGFNSAIEKKDQVITVAYQNLTATFTVTITSAIFSSLQIVTPPSKTTYLLGEAFDAIGLKVNAVYSDGQTQEITDYTVTGFDSTVAGEAKTVYIEYSDKKAEITVKVIDKSVRSLTIDTEPSKKIYYEGDSFEPAGLSVRVTYSDGTSEYTTSYTSDFDQVVQAAGTNKTVTLTFGKKTAAFRINVLEAAVDFITISNLPDKTEYYVGDSFDPTGMIVVAKLKNGKSKVITDYTTNFSSIVRSAGRQTCLVKYQECVASFFVYIYRVPLKLKVVTLPEKIAYRVGGSLDLEGLEVGLVYDNKEEDIEPIDDFTTRGFDSSSEGVKTVAIIYNEAGLTFTASYECYVGEAKEFLVENVNSTYYVDSDFSPTDINCYLVYKDNSKRKITQFSVDDFDTSVVGTQTKTVKYYDKDFYKTYEADYQYRVLNLFDYCASIMKKIMNSNITVTGSANSGVFIKGRTVTLNSYEICKYEITQEIYKRIMGTNPSNYDSNPADGEIQSKRPVEYVNWYDAITFCNKLTLLSGGTTEDLVYSVEGITDWANLSASSIPRLTNEKWDNATIDLTKKGYRLPTEAEWEFAARGGDPSDSAWNYTYSGSNTIDSVAWNSSNSGYATHQEGLKLPNKLGLYDMSGNVYEWCNDWYGSIESGNVDNPIGPSAGTARCTRGGCYRSSDYFRVDYRDSYIPYIRVDDIGFRIARTLTE